MILAGEARWQLRRMARADFTKGMWSEPPINAWAGLGLAETRFLGRGPSGTKSLR